MVFQEVGEGGMDWIALAQDEDIWQAICECGNEPSGSKKYRELHD
jgi:hypothetical protein